MISINNLVTNTMAIGGSSGHAETILTFGNTIVNLNKSGELNNLWIMDDDGDDATWEYILVYDGDTKIFKIDLTSTNIGNTVTSIGDWAFMDCISLTSVTIPDSVTSIGTSAFYGCISLTSVTIPNSVESIGEWAFYNCNVLTSMTIPNSVESIGESAFNECSGLTSVTIGSGVTDIGDGAFAGCSSLASVTIDKTKTQVESMGYSNWGLGFRDDPETGDYITFQVTIHCNDNQDIVINPQS